MEQALDLKMFENFRDWIPARCYLHENKPFVDWCYLGGSRLTEPFFDDSIQIRLREPFNLLFRHQTPFALLGELMKVSEGLKPTGFSTKKLSAKSPGIFSNGEDSARKFF